HSTTSSLQAAGHASVAGVKLAAAAVAIPLKGIGVAGKMSGYAGDAMWEVADGPVHKPLPVADDIYVLRPDQALNTE
ncbi:MAG: hypothetical protein AAF420_08665, partial [Pseudomonadota bacterium]